MDKSIVALLNSNLRVIIPDFGAFIIRQKDPRIIVFNEFLRYNDGLLIEFIVKTEGIDMDIARQQLSEYTEHATKIIETGSLFTIEDLGVLQKDRSGKIVFTPEHETGMSEPSIIDDESPVLQLSEKEIEDFPEPEPEPEPEPGPDTKPKPEFKPKPKPKPKPKAHPKGKNIQKIVPPATPQATLPPDLKTEDVILTVEPLTKMPEVTSNNEIETSEAEVTKIPTPVSDPPSGNRINHILKWVIIILLANVAILAGFIFHDNISEIFTSKKEPAIITDSVLQQLSDSVIDAATDTSMIFKEALETATFKDNIGSQGNLRYYIVAGCFRDEINADELVKSLKDSGFKSEKFGKIGNLYAVCFASYDDKELAVNELKRIREEIQPEAWMTRF